MALCFLLFSLGLETARETEQPFTLYQPRPQSQSQSQPKPNPRPSSVQESEKQAMIMIRNTVGFRDTDHGFLTDCKGRFGFVARAFLDKVQSVCDKIDAYLALSSSCASTSTSASVITVTHEQWTAFNAAIAYAREELPRENMAYLDRLRLLVPSFAHSDAAAAATSVAERTHTVSLIDWHVARRYRARYMELFALPNVVEGMAGNHRSLESLTTQVTHKTQAQLLMHERKVNVEKASNALRVGTWDVIKRDLIDGLCPVVLLPPQGRVCDAACKAQACYTHRTRPSSTDFIWPPPMPSVKENPHQDFVPLPTMAEQLARTVKWLTAMQTAHQNWLEVVASRVKQKRAKFLEDQSTFESALKERQDEYDLAKAKHDDDVAAYKQRRADAAAAKPKSRVVRETPPAPFTLTSPDRDEPLLKKLGVPKGWRCDRLYAALFRAPDVANEHPQEFFRYWLFNDLHDYHDRRWGKAKKDTATTFKLGKPRFKQWQPLVCAANVTDDESVYHASNRRAWVFVVNTVSCEPGKPIVRYGVVTKIHWSKPLFVLSEQTRQRSIKLAQQQGDIKLEQFAREGTIVHRTCLKRADYVDVEIYSTSASASARPCVRVSASMILPMHCKKLVEFLPT